MSAWIVDREHIRALVDAAVHYGTIDVRGEPPYSMRADVAALVAEYQAVGAPVPDVPSLVGQILWRENVRSINARYPDTVDKPDGRPGPIGDGPGLGEPYVHKARRFPLLLGAVGKAVACYEYQTCEHDGWAASSSQAFCHALVADALALCEGYEACPWGIKADDVTDAGAAARAVHYGRYHTPRPYAYARPDLAPVAQRY